MSRPTQRGYLLVQLDGHETYFKGARKGGIALDQRMLDAGAHYVDLFDGPAEASGEVVSDEDRQTVLGIIAWLSGASQGDRPNTSRGDAAAALQRLLSATQPAQAPAELTKRTSIDAMCKILVDHRIERKEYVDCTILYEVTFEQIRNVYDAGRHAALKNGAA